MKPTWKQYQINYPHLRHRKIEKAIMFAIQRAKYFLGVSIPEDLEFTQSELRGKKLRILSKVHHELYKELYDLDALIRWTDDKIDEDILTRESYKESEIAEAIESMIKKDPVTKPVSKLFKYERRLAKIKESHKNSRVAERLLQKIAQNRSIDIDLLALHLAKRLGSKDKTSLSKNYLFLQVWEANESLLTDLWYIKQDLPKNNFNIFIKAKSLNVPVESILRFYEDNIKSLKVLRKEIKNHPHSDFLELIITSMEKLYNYPYKKLMNLYFSDEEQWYKMLLSVKL